MNEKNRIEEVLDLCEQQLEGTLTPEGVIRLEELVRKDAGARRAYVEYLHQHASLYLNTGPQTESSDKAPDEHSREQVLSFPFPSPAEKAGKSRLLYWPIAVALAASVVLTATIIWLFPGLQENKVAESPSANAVEFVTLIETKNATWKPGRLSTEAGSRLSSGRLRLDQGLARLRFDNGVQVTLEAPADLELISLMRCVLHEGVIVANVPPPATGFVIETATARLIDYGTEFGVSVGPEGKTRVQVLEGIVDVEHLASGKAERLTEGRSAWISADGLTVNEATGLESQRAAFDPSVIEPSGKTITLTTASGRGKDAYVQPDGEHPHRSDVLLLVKNYPGNFSRKAWLGFDLAGVPLDEIHDARLILTMAPTGYGYVSFTTETTFSIYGLLDQALDDWEEDNLQWENAPANVLGGGSLDPSTTTHLGSFEVGEGVTSGQFSISGATLVNFLRQDINGIATLIIVRDTPGTRLGSLVHGFESKRHPTGTPPMLRIVLQGKPRS